MRKLKAKYKIAYEDCFAAALALIFKALLVTGDPEFNKLAHELSIEWIVRHSSFYTALSK